MLYLQHLYFLTRQLLLFPQDTLIATQALSLLADLNQDRSAYEMNFVFKSDQDPTWSKTVHLHRGNWFIPQKVTVRYLHSSIDVDMYVCSLLTA